MTRLFQKNELFSLIFLAAILVLVFFRSTSFGVVAPPGVVVTPPEVMVKKVSGWAWSSNIGWISFNCSNVNSCDKVNYGVSVNLGGLFSGYAWSSNVGWISFQKSDLDGCPDALEDCKAKVAGGLTDGAYPKPVTGWAKILSTNSWMKLRGTTQGGSSYGVELAENGDFSGWSWDNVIGWVHWNGSTYKVKLGTGVVLPPPPPPPPPPIGDGEGGGDQTDFKPGDRKEISPP